MRCFRLLVLGSLGLLGVVAAAGCAFKPHPEGTGSGGISGGSGGITGEGSDAIVYRSDAAREYFTAPDVADPEAGPSVDANCQNQPFTVIAPPPDLLIVLDRSGSMNDNAMGVSCGNNGCGAASKWTQVTTAINDVVMATEGSINWGLKFFGNDNACGVTAGAAVAPGPNNAAAIAAAIAARANRPGSSTPTRAGELSAGEYLATLTDTNPRFVLLATDGQPNCMPGMAAGTTDDQGAIDAVTTVKDMGFKTFVIGIATGANGDATLNSMAVNGGYPRVGAPQQYYSVATTADLVMALGTIQTITKGMCTYPLGTPGPQADMNKVTVTVDGNPSSRDAADGWHYDPGMSSITFTGATCDQLMAGTLKNVQVLYGCKIEVL